MKIKTSELTGTALDWAVAKCEGHTGAWIEDDLFGNHIERPYSPSTDWSQGGPIIEREDIALHPVADTKGWFAHKVWGAQGDYLGSTPLIAAMRCYVASKLDDEVEVPEELT